MIIGVQGTRSFSDYSNIFLRAMRVALEHRQEHDKKVIFYCAGPVNIVNMCKEFVNITERTLKSHGITVKLMMVPPKWLKNHIADIDYFAFFSNPKEPVSDIVLAADAKEVPAGVYRY